MSLYGKIIGANIQVSIWEENFKLVKRSYSFKTTLSEVGQRERVTRRVRFAGRTSVVLRRSDDVERKTRSWGREKLIK